MMRLSARNQLPGTMASITLGAVIAEVVVEIGGGQQIVSAITHGSVELFGLREGQAVVAVIKTTEVMVGIAEDGE
jgi:molybdate transport system regulatory protein